MTIADATPKVKLNGNGATVAFPFSFPAPDTAHIVAIVTDALEADTLLVEGVDYTVALVGGGGTVTTTDPVVTGSTITIMRVVPLAQPIEVDNQGGFFPETHEDAFDYLTMIDQQQQEQIDRAVKVAQTSSDTADDLATDLYAARDAAQAAQTGAESAEADAVTAEAGSQTARAGAQTARAGAETARTGAETAEANAGTSATNAATSAADAAASAAELTAHEITYDHTELHTHANAVVLATVTADVVANEHAHANAAVLDTVTSDVVANEHTHSNATTLDAIPAHSGASTDQVVAKQGDGSLAWADQAGGAAAPVGSMLDFAGPSAPVGWLLCDGAAVSRTTYATLYTTIGVSWGVGDGSTTFNVPDLRGRSTIGVGTGSGLTARTLGASGGEEDHVLSIAELAAHNHSHNMYAPNSTIPGVGSSGNLGPAVGGTIDNTGSDGAHNNMSPFAAVTKIIKT